MIESPFEMICFITFIAAAAVFIAIIADRGE
jgi:hypothetical protein